MSFTGIVLAGGRSSRMGRDKAMLEWRGRSLIDTAIALLREAGAARVLVSGDRPAHAGVSDAMPGLGPVGGLVTVLARCDDGHAVVVPVDMPRLRMATLTALRDALAHSRAACFEAHPLPCALVVDDAARAALAAVVANAPRGASMRSALQALGAVALPCTGAEDFASVNTPEAWAALGS